MKALLIVLVLAGAGYYAYTTYSGRTGASNAGQYSLKTVPSNPIPRTEFFQLWNDVALNFCTDLSYITPGECRATTKQRHSACAASAGAKAPDKIADVATSKELGRAYLNCVRPYPKCKGVEVKTEDEARQHCG